MIQRYLLWLLPLLVTLTLIWLRRALLANKHVYVEKPLARDVNHAKELDALATERNLILMVGHLTSLSSGR